MNKDYSKIIAILDESWSMGHICNETIGGFNKFIEEQKKIPGKADVTVVTFSYHNKIRTIRDSVDLQEITPLTKEDYDPCGCTALLDAIGSTIDNTGQELSAMNEQDRPGRVMVLVMTDGEENSSKEYKLEDIKKKVTHQQDVYNWEFVFIGADIDSFDQGGSVGFHTTNIMNFNKSGQGIDLAFKSLSKNVSKYRTYTAPTCQFEKADYMAQLKLGTDNSKADVVDDQ